MKKVIMLLVFVALSSSGLAIEWHNPSGIAGQDNDWYNPLNWSGGALPTSSDLTYWRYASSNGSYSPIVINGGTAQSGTSICDIWYAGTASLTVTNSATYGISGYLAVRNGAADAAHSPANAEFNVEGGSTVNVSGDSFIGRKLVSGSSAFGNCTVNIDGAGTVFNQGGYMWLGNSNNATVATTVNVTNGAILNINTTGGLRFQPDTINEIFPVVNLDGGFINIKGNRVGEVAGWLSNNYLLGYGQSSNIVYSYDEQSGYTNISSLPEPTTLSLFALGMIGFLRRKNK